MAATVPSICNLALARFGDDQISSLSDNTAQAEYCALFYEPVRDEVLRAHPWNFAITRKAVDLAWVALVGVSLTNNGTGLIRVSATGHGLVTGDRIHLRNVDGIVGANGTWLVTKINDDSFDLQGSSFSGAHTSGTGKWIKAPAFGWNYRYALPSDLLRLVQLNSYLETEVPARWEIEGGVLLTNEERAQLRYVAKVTDPNLFDSLFVDAFTAKLAAKLAKPLTGSSTIAEALLTEYTRLTAPLARRIDASEGEPIVKPAWVESSLVQARYGSEIG